jgi:hypothetical protein
MRTWTLPMVCAWMVCGWATGCGSSESAANDADGDAGASYDATGDARAGDSRAEDSPAEDSPAQDSRAEDSPAEDSRVEDSSADAWPDAKPAETGSESGAVDAVADSAADGRAEAAAPRDAGTSDAGICGSLSTGPMPPSGDMTYAWSSSAPACLSGAFCQVDCDGALLQGILACEAVQGGFFWGQGSVYFRVVGRQSGACVFDIGTETEGSVSVQRCTTPLPVQPWAGLYEVNHPNSSSAPNIPNGLHDCTRTATCSVLPGAPNPCERSPAGPPLCPSTGVRGPC